MQEHHLLIYGLYTVMADGGQNALILGADTGIRLLGKQYGDGEFLSMSMIAIAGWRNRNQPEIFLNAHLSSDHLAKHAERISEKSGNKPKLKIVA